MSNNNKVYALIFSALGIAINIALGTLVSMISIPLLFLDTIGTIFTAAVFGPVYGMLTGGLTNVIQGLITNPKDIPFALVNVAVGLIVGLIARKKSFNYLNAVITGLILAVVCPLIGTPIAIFVYGGITGDFNDVFFTWLKQTGQTIFAAAFLPRIASNIIDKVVSCVLVAFLITRLPQQYLQRGREVNTGRE